MQSVLPNASGVPASGGFAEAAQSLGGIIASKKTAFVTTLVGLFCAIVLSFFNFMLARAQSAFYDALERFTTAELLPATVPAVEDETMMERLSLQLAESFARLGDISRIQEKSTELQKGMQEEFSATIRSIHDLALQAVPRGPEAESGGALAGLVKQMGDTHAALARTAQDAAARGRAGPAYPAVRPGGWGAVGAELGSLAADAVRELRRNPLVALGGAFGAVVLAVIIW
jgi:hypothetical protein